MCACARGGQGQYQMSCICSPYSLKLGLLLNLELTDLAMLAGQKALDSSIFIFPALGSQKSADPSGLLCEYWDQAWFLKFCVISTLLTTSHPQPWLGILRRGLETALSTAIHIQGSRGLAISAAPTSSVPQARCRECAWCVPVKVY